MTGHPSVATGMRAVRTRDLRLHIRIQHLLLTGSALTLAATGLPQKLSSLGASQWLMDTAGGIETLRAIHHAAGAVLIVAALYHVSWAVISVVANRRAAPLSMVPDARDYLNAIATVLFFVGRRQERPALREPNYFQKLDYWVLAWAVAAMGFTGVVRLFPARATSLLSGDTTAAALESHGDLGLLFLVWVAVVHLAYLTLSPHPSSSTEPREGSGESDGQE